MLLRWVLLAWCRTITFPHVGRVTHLILFRALIYATTLLMSWKSYVTLERSVCLPPSTRPGVLFHALPRDVSLACITFLLVVSRSFPWLNLFTVCMIEGCVVQWKGQTPRLFLPPRALSTSLSITSGIP